jgi:hypothetical protein
LKASHTQTEGEGIEWDGRRSSLESRNQGMLKDRQITHPPWGRDWQEITQFTCVKDVAKGNEGCRQSGWPEPFERHSLSGEHNFHT